MMNFKDFSKIILSEFPELNEGQMLKFEALQGLYKDWNSKINVISRKDIDALYLHHILHSLAIATYLKRERHDIFIRLLNDENIKILDLGTGGGFPGIPLSIFFPNVSFTLCDSVGKKILVADSIAKDLNINNVITINDRAENLKENYDFIVSRAVTSLDKFYPWVKSKFNYSILYLKGGDIVEEISILMQKNNFRKGRISTWNIKNWLQDDFFNEKMVIDIKSK